ncbi:GMC family oxidoreductase N-terminal domain-containing protein [Actinoplanes bogorensis]|uniref:GMC family oxidoreductase N-terminal domain-containing protein n=1 Tax=Paractinoplanes bogorensis TaxID=1610840 RepID=A0ABS5Z3C3_9ACTN|nr:GMC family oxidoreductase N-terminal domain-containing protein [Actinoplanes bogorensis]MBU2670190.1 GMC family oxidoreductase N-terminal domain-containing protein [Actinoplanes bogorensis]
MPYDSSIVDYIIVGSGAAGSVLAHRLSQTPDCSVLVLEAGGADHDESLRVPADFLAVGSDPRYTKQFATEPFGDGQVEQWSVGRITGGSTTVNGMIWNRGGAGDYDAWAAAGWGWARFLEAFRMIEGSSGDGRQRIGLAGRDPASDLWLDTLARREITPVRDLNGSGGERAAYAPLTIADGHRVSAADAYLHDAVKRPNVQLRLRCDVRLVVFDGTTATGVEAVTPDGEVRFSARREVIICAGTLGSPLLLERSGVGDPQVLQAAGVPVVAENRAVGGNLRQHRGISLITKLSNLPAAGAPFGTTTVVSVLKSDPGAAGPDTEVIFHPFGGPDADGGIAGAAVGYYPRTPTSTGSIHITGPGLDDVPRLVPNYLSTDQDRQVLVAGFARVRAIMATDPIASVMTDAAPVPAAGDEAAIVRHSLEHGFVANHQIGTCALGPAGVVTDDLRVRGTDGLRVADASVMPTLPSGNTAAPSMAIGWIAGDLVSKACMERAPYA